MIFLVHTQFAHIVWFLWTSDQLVAEAAKHTTNETEESVSSVGFFIFFFLLFSFVYVDSFDITEQVTLLTRFACGHKYAAWRSAAKCYGYVWLVWGSDCVLVCSLRLVPLGFEPAIPAIKLPQTYTLDPTVTGIGAGTPVILPYTRNFLTDT